MCKLDVTHEIGYDVGLRIATLPTESRPQATCTDNFLNFGYPVFEIHLRTNG